jgi:AcrR family transcriptional regulator
MPIDRRVLRTRSALHDAIVALVRTKSYDAISVEDILKEANVGRATFYAHFLSKDDLLERSLDRLEQVLASRTRAHPAEGADDACLFMFEHVGAYRDVHRALTDSRGGAIVRRAFDAVLTRFFEGAVPDTVGKALPRELMLRHFVGTFHTVMDWWFNAKTGVAPAAAADMYRQLIVHGVGPGAARGFLAAPERD